MSLSSELQNVLPNVVNAPEQCPVATPVTQVIDPHHPNQEVQLEQINEGEMIENKLVIPDDMERYLSQVVGILDPQLTDAEEQQLTDLSPANPKPETKTEDFNSCCNDTQTAQPVYNDFHSNNEDLSKNPVKPNNRQPAQNEPKPPPQPNRNYVNNYQGNQNCPPHHDHYNHYYHHQNYHYCQQNQQNHYHPPPNYQQVANQPNRIPERNGYNYNYRCPVNRSVQSNPVTQYPVQNQNYQQPNLPHNHQPPPSHMCQTHCYPHDHCSNYQQPNCTAVCQPNNLPQCGNTQIHNCTMNSHHVMPNPPAPPPQPVPNHGTPGIPPNPPPLQHVNCGCNHEMKQNCAQQHKMCGNCHYPDNNDNFKENDKNMYKNYNDNFRDIENEIQCTDISQSEVRMPREAYQRTLEYVQQCQIWSNEVSSSTHPISNMVVNDLTSSLNSLAQENRFFQMIN